MKTTNFILTMALLSLMATGAITAVSAEEPTDSTADQAIQSDTQDLVAQEISAQDLEVKDQKFLPDNPFYFLKEWTRNVRMAFTFNEIKKTELENKFTNERLIELKKLTENGVSSEKIKKATENYQNAIDKIKDRADKIKEKAADSEAVNKFLEKFTNQQVLQEKILRKLETQVPEAAFEKIKEAREQHMEKFGEVMQKLEDRQDKIKEKIENTLQNGDASNSEILDKIKERMPDDMKEKLESMRGNMMEKVNDKMMKKVLERNEDKDCPTLTNPSSDFCKQGKIKLERDDKGCVIKIGCILPESITNRKECKTDEDCPQSNCGATATSATNCIGIKTKCVEGKCKTIKMREADCKKLWWFDNENKTCQQKEFCGAYMYLGLKTFAEPEKCKRNLNQDTNSLTPQVNQ